MSERQRAHPVTGEDYDPTPKARHSTSRGLKLTPRATTLRSEVDHAIGSSDWLGTVSL